MVATLAIAPATLHAQSQTCVNSPSTSGKSYLVVCNGSDGAQGAPGAGIGAPGGIPDIAPITLNGNFSGVAGQSTITVHAFGGAGGTGGTGKDGNNPGGTGGVGGSAGALDVAIQSGTIYDGGNALAPVSLAANGGAGGGGGIHGGLGGKGGEAGAGGAGGTLAFLLGIDASVISTHANVAAIDLRSYGGNGGNAADSEFFTAGQKSNPGGNGGQGGSIGTAAAPITISGVIESLASGVFAESLGGDGGTGGNATDNTINGTGGDGGAGASGGAIYITNQGGSIKAQGGSSTVELSDGDDTSVYFQEATAGIQAVSQGGAGGAGGAGHGGFGGGTGGNGGVSSGDDNPVQIVNDHGTISTLGDLSAGILAQNLGGTGGDGASGSGWFVSKGGNGAQGGSAGAVTLIGLGTRVPLGTGFTVDGSITTVGDYSAGMVAQSIGGGGGFGGAATASGTAVSVSIGGNGDNGGNGGTVTVDNGSLDADTGLWSGGNSISTSGNYALGILAQSIGGGGGTGGAVKSLTAGAGVAVAVGGNGGTGGDGGTVEVNNGEAIATQGALAYGVVAQSIGGGGGNGGGAFAVNGGTVVQAASAVGGTGGNGGKGNAVTLDNSNTIVTSGDGALGVMAQSIGGGGGNGGTATSVLLSATVPQSYNFTVTATVGGNGGTGGDAGAVSMTNAGSVITNGTGAWGVLLQSIGGGGGNGGDADSLSIATKTSTVQTNVTVGGSGGAGGIGGAVNLVNNNKGIIETHGDDANAIVAQSIGGGGGNGGSASARQLNVVGGDNDKDVSASLTLAIGGNGGGGNVGGAVTLDNVDGRVFTTGSNAKAIFAQSIGGGGGWAGGASAMGSGGSSAKFNANVGVGGSGGAASNGGAVTVTNGGTIYTTGANSAAIYAQSVGGGGGTGGSGAGNSGADGNVQLTDYLAQRTGVNGDLIALGNNVWGVKTQVKDAQDQLAHLKDLAEAYEMERTQPGSVNWLQKGKSQLTVDLGGGFGGKGGSSGSGGTVTISNSGLVSTARAYSDAIFAQSIGGGGGDAGASHSSANSTAINANVAVGGNGGSAGYGGDVTVTNSGDIATSGDMSHAINAESIGGGGGRGGVSVGTSGESGEFSLSIGGDGGSSGGGGTVTINAGGTLTTGAPTTVGIDPTGAGSIGILAQSVGGGGGEVTVLGSETGEAGTAESSYNWGELLPHLPTIKIGGSPAGNDTRAAWGNGGAVDIDLTGTIATRGKDAYGILAQSIGGGGGVVFSPITAADKSDPDAMFGDGNMNGSGGNVSVLLGGNAGITTHGDGAVGILAQSIGGGGGLIGGMSDVDVTAIATTSSSIHLGSGGDVSILTNAGSNIETFGARAHGIVAQSASGGGFFAGDAQTGFAVSTASCGGNCAQATDVDVSLNGVLAVHGAGSYGVFAQNRGGSSGSTIDIAVDASGVITSDQQSAGAIYIDNPGGTSTVSNYDYIVATGASPVAVNGTAATINNHYYIAGDLLTTEGSDVVNNYQSGVFIPNTRMVASTFNNMSGAALAVGYLSNVSATLTGNLVNDGWLVFNLPGGGATTSLNVGGTATLSADSFLGIVGSPVGIEQFTALTAASLRTSGTPLAGQVSESEDGQFAQVQNPTFGYTVQISGNSLLVTPQLNSASQLGVSLSTNEAATANYLSAAFAAGNAGYSRAAFEGIYDKAPTASAYKQVLDEIGGHTLGAIMSDRLPLQRAFIDNMLSCPDLARDGASVDETSCVWGRVQQSWISNDYDAGFHAGAQHYQMGAQVEIGDGWFVGASGGYENASTSSSNTDAHLQGDVFSAGALIKRVTGNWTIAASATGTLGDFDTRRMLSVSDTPATASPRTQGAAMQVRADYQVPMKGWYLRPSLAVTAQYLHLDGFAETGSDFPLRVAATGNWTLAVAPSLEFGTRVEWAGVALRPFVRGGVIYERNNDWIQQVSLGNLNVDLGNYASQIRLPDWSETVAAGVEAYAGEKLSLRLEYSGELNSVNRAQTTTFKLGYRF